ncbi:hypothetical protein ElyMa_002542500 [Elysia marginata]|uniref:Uncharacterized protein n=1 Tax=Elysia marginata TaxID=1093978 RepID=A0AAV4GWC7_9GAST|nr:hypothetical protein ElyMa_002542500 [Elysia marginata]
MSTPTICNIFREGVRASMQASTCAGSSPPPECRVLDLATKRDLYIQTKYSPSGFASKTARDVRNKELAIIQSNIDDDVKALQSKYGADAPIDGITWNALTECLWAPNGTPGGPNHNKYFKRNDLVALGYQPQPALGHAAQKKLPLALTSHIPIWMDHAFGPDLAVIVIFGFLLVIFAALLYSTYKWSKAAPQREMAAAAARRAKNEAHDPYQGTAFESFPDDPNSKWKSLIPIYEAQGYCMEAYRKKLGLPIAEHCESRA